MILSFHSILFGCHTQSLSIRTNKQLIDRHKSVHCSFTLTYTEFNRIHSLLQTSSKNHLTSFCLAVPSFAKAFEKSVIFFGAFLLLVHTFVRIFRMVVFFSLVSFYIVRSMSPVYTIEFGYYLCVVIFRCGQYDTICTIVVQKDHIQ